jgi:hypothetical protein
VTKETKRIAVLLIGAGEAVGDRFGHAGKTSVKRLGVAAPPYGSVANDHRAETNAAESLASVISRALHPFE